MGLEPFYKCAVRGSSPKHTHGGMVQLYESNLASWTYEPRGLSLLLVQVLGSGMGEEFREQRGTDISDYEYLVAKTGEIHRGLQRLYKPLFL